MNKTLFSIVIVISLCSAAQASPSVDNTTLSAEARKGTEDGLKILNEKLPKMIDPDTRLDHAKFNDYNRLTHYYTLINISSKEGGAYRSAEVAKMATQMAARQNCNTPAMRFLLEQGVILSHSFNANDGAHLMAVDVTRQDCNSL